MQNFPDDFRLVWFPEFAGLTGEFELQWLNQDGDYETVKFSHDPEALVALALELRGPLT